MNNQFKYLALIILIVAVFSCQQGGKEVVTEKIQYDVNIKSPDPDYDWWIQNLPGPAREKLVETILNGAISGKFQAYDYYNNPITPAEVSSILSDTSVVRLTQVEPPYESYDSVIIYNIVQEDILRIRFLEEWKMNPEDLSFEKKIVGIAPVARRVVMNMERWQPLFWIFPDKEFEKNLNKK
ncbi:MAG: hypothetical protein L3J31_08110 [Bacteroidales bacterium]|nr:hypothetical protein [Bacteroidales bacterium]MCF6342751.1 hypothetical protein [Bacteroidales bacterium]